MALQSQPNSLSLVPDPSRQGRPPTSLHRQGLAARLAPERGGNRLAAQAHDQERQGTTGHANESASRGWRSMQFIDPKGKGSPEHRARILTDVVSVELSFCRVERHDRIVPQCEFAKKGLNRAR
jgi:hypothetical protein